MVWTLSRPVSPYGLLLPMPTPPCPACTLEDVLSHPDHWECATCGHEWPKAAAPETVRVVKDANGNPLAEGDSITLIKDLKLGGSQVLKAGAKAKNIRLQDGDHEIACKVDGVAVALKACFVKKA
jgi:protein PhnA